MVKLKQSLESSFDYMAEMAQDNIDKARLSMIIEGDRAKYAYHKNIAKNYYNKAEKLSHELALLTLTNLN